MPLSNNLILASGSPRRKQLLSEAGFDFEIRTVPIEETYPEDLAASQVAEFLAKEKNKAHRQIVENEIILTADTVVILNETILGKPKSQKEAIETLELLSGKIHMVTTGVCISDAQKIQSFSTTTKVKFRELTIEEIHHYVENYKPMDKAGSYAIQEWIGLIGIEWIEGSYYNVVGLPVSQVQACLLQHFSHD